MRLRRHLRGFTLIELMIVVVIVGILAALSTYGVRKYAASSKSAEALQNLGGIGRAVQAVATRETMAGTLLTAQQEAGNTGNSNNGSGSSGSGNGNGNNGNGATVTFNIPGLCGSANAVPSSMNSVKGAKYQPDHSAGKDYNSGDKYTGWKCLQFSIPSPHLYQYRYKVSGPPIEVTLPHGGTPKGLSQDRIWSASAQGDIDGDGRTSWFILQGYIMDTREIRMAPAIDTVDPEE